jgi:hypothetical protein
MPCLNRWDRVEDADHVLPQIRYRTDLGAIDERMGATDLVAIEQLARSRIHSQYQDRAIGMKDIVEQPKSLFSS